MISTKSDKELAFLHDLFIAPDWGERFAELIDEHVNLPKEGDALYMASGTGGHAIALQERAGDKVNLLCLDENEECVEIAKAKATTANEATRFERARLDQTALEENHFDLVIGNASLVPRDRVRSMLSEMVRVAAPGSNVLLALPTASSFGEFFSIYWEALHNTGLTELESDVEHLITELPTVSEAEEMAEELGLEAVESWSRIEEFDYESGEQFINSPLVADFLMNDWLASVPEDWKTAVAKEITRLINEERHEAEFALSVKATLIAGRKSHSH
jgi:ubiquinone/menaquinone biosynthesis C-methylase UbiE